MQNMVQDGDVIVVTMPYDRSSGDFVQVGDSSQTSITSQIGGICVATIASGLTGPVRTKGVFDITALSTDTGNAYAPVYWDNTNKRCTVTASGNNKIGVLLAAKTAGQTTMRVRLNGTFPLL